MKRQHVLFLRYTTIILLAGILFVGGAYLSTLTGSRRGLELNGRRIIDAYREILSTMLQDAGSDALFLSSLTSLQSYVESGNLRDLQDVQRDFVSFADKKIDSFDQIRYLNSRGQEIVRINNRGNEHGVIVPDNELQNKADRYYFIESNDLPRGEVYLSPFDLNVERGEIERPLKPMIRYATPVVDNDGNHHGVIVLNFLGDQLLKQLDWEGNTVRGNLFLLNGEGYWLKGRSPMEEWGFMIEGQDSMNLRLQEPGVWAMITDSSSGHFYRHGAFHVFSTVDPHEAAQISAERHHHLKLTDPKGEKGENWILLLVTPRSLVTATARKDAILVGTFFAVMLVPLLIMAWVIAEATVRREDHKKLEREQEQLRKVQSLARAVAHEFRQPLAGLKLAADLTLMAEEDQLYPALRKPLSRIPPLVARVDTLVNRLFQITRFETMPYPGGTEYVDLEKSSIADSDSEPGEKADEE